MKKDKISYEIFNLLEDYFEKKILNKYGFIEDLIDLSIFFKYDICENLNDFNEINPRYL